MDLPPDFKDLLAEFASADVIEPWSRLDGDGGVEGKRLYR